MHIRTGGSGEALLDGFRILSSKIPNAGHIERNFIMTIEEFRDCLFDYYQTEVRGEAFFEAMLRKFDQRDHLYKIGSLLQLETETKSPVATNHLGTRRFCRGAREFASNRPKSCCVDQRWELGRIRRCVERGGRAPDKPAT